MSSSPEKSAPGERAANVPRGFLRHYVFSTDHKIIGIQYFALALVAVALGIFLSLLIRMHLVWPGARIPWLPGGVMTPEEYLAMVTMHGTIMIFFVLTTAPQAAFGNYFLPLQIGAPEMAFPRLNRLSFWGTFLAFVCMVAAFLVPGGGPASGWSPDRFLSGMGEASGPGAGPGQALWILSIALFCLASLLGALNFIVTTIDMRAPGMKLMRMPLTVWSWFVTAILVMATFSVLLAAGVLLLLDRSTGATFFVFAGGAAGSEFPNSSRNAPLLWQHLFWFFGHPEVYIAILPGMGVVSHVLANFSRKPVYGYRVMVWATCAIGFLGFCVWGHHMFVSGLNPYANFSFSVLTLSIGVPAVVVSFNWLATLWNGKIQLTTAMLFSLGFVSLFVTGGLSGLFLAQPAFDLLLHSTYYVTGHFHLIMAMAAIFGIFSAMYFWYPKMFGRMLSEPLGKIHFWITFLGAYLIFVPMHFLGVESLPQGSPSAARFSHFASFAGLNHFLTLAAFATGAAQLVFLYNFFRSLQNGKAPGENPWKATTLEWAGESSCVEGDAGGIGPAVYRGPYVYGAGCATGDFSPQNAAPEIISPKRAGD